MVCVSYEWILALIYSRYMLGRVKRLGGLGYSNKPGTEQTSDRKKQIVHVLIVTVQYVAGCMYNTCVYNFCLTIPRSV